VKTVAEQISDQIKQAQSMLGYAVGSCFPFYPLDSAG